MTLNGLVVIFETKEEAFHRAYLNYFMVGFNMTAASLALCLLDIHWLIMGGGFVAYSLVTSVLVLMFYPRVTIDFIILELIILIFLLSFCYGRIKDHKINFLNLKKINSLHKEQQEIFKYLPDGAMIHRNLISKDD